jgi:hypothetical protein
MRALAWFSCGSASAVAAKLAFEKYGDSLEILYCDTLKYEHPDNLRFMQDVEKWIGKEIKIIRSEKYADIYDVFDKTGWLIGPSGARCTTELKRVPRKKYQLPDDIHIFGFTFEEIDRIERFKENNFETAEFPLFENRITKRRCHEIIYSAGIEQPAMYKLGFNNNNCIGCVKGQGSYWIKIKKYFPEIFKKMAEQERKMEVAINKKYENGQRVKVFLDEMKDQDFENQLEFDIDCGVLCNNENVESE